MDTAQWPQEIVVKPMDEIIVATNNSNSVAATCSNSALKPCITSSSSSQSCKKAKPQREVQQIINCPRCNSTNTKFCYYNNYSLSQPRYFCKTCRRYWTEGGSLRNIPVGGGTRKNNKRSSNSSPSSSLSQSNSSISSKKIALTSANNNDHRRGVAVAVPLVPAHVPNSCQNPNKINLYGHHQDLNLGFTHDQTANDFKTFSQLIQAPSFENIGNTHREAMESLTGLQSSSRGLGNSFMPMLTNMNNDHNNISASNTFLGFPLNASDQYHQFMKPVSALSFSLDNELGMNNSTTSTGPGSHLFPFEDLKLQATDHNATDAANTTDDHSDHDDQQSNGKDEHSNGFWTGMLGTGGGGSW